MPRKVDLPGILVKMRLCVWQDSNATIKSDNRKLKSDAAQLVNSGKVMEAQIAELKAQLLDHGSYVSDARDAKLRAEESMRAANDQIHRLKSEVSQLKVEARVAEQNVIRVRDELEQKHKEQTELLVSKVAKLEGDLAAQRQRVAEQQSANNAQETAFQREKDGLLEQIRSAQHDLRMMALQNKELSIKLNTAPTVKHVAVQAGVTMVGPAKWLNITKALNAEFIATDETRLKSQSANSSSHYASPVAAVRAESPKRTVDAKVGY